MTFRLRSALLVLLSLALLTGCGVRAHKSASNVLRYPILAAPTTFDPAMVQDGTTIDLLQNIFEGLVQWTPQNTLAPALAEKWDVSQDGRTYTFHLRKAFFQDGAPITAEDVSYSLERALNPKLQSPVAVTYLGDIVGAKEFAAGKSPELAGVKVVDPQTIAITIEKPKLYWIYNLTYPTGYVVSKAEASMTPLTDAEVARGAGSGPFKLNHYDKDSRVFLDANSKYWDGAPKITGIERPVVIDAETRHALYVSGQVDIVDEQFGDLAADSKDPKLSGEIKFWPRAATYYIGLNQTAFPAFKDKRVRQALAYATDKQKIRHVVLMDKLDTAEDLLPEGIPGYDPAFKGLPYDPAKAKQLLAEAGYPGGKGFPTIQLSYRQSYPVLRDTVELLRDMWQQNLGITVEGKVTEWGQLLDLEDKGALPCFHIRWAADYLDPQDFYSVLLRTGAPENHVGYSNPQFDSLCDAADSEQDKIKRNALYRRAARIAADDVPRIPIYYQKDIELVKPYVHNLDDGLMGHLPFKHLTLSK